MKRASIPQDQHHHEAVQQITDFFYCEICGKSRQCGPEEMITFLSDDWPMCCEQLMTHTSTSQQ